MSMKKLAILSAILMLVLGVSMAAAQTPPPRSATHFSNPLLNEVVRMTNAGLRNDTIIAYVRARQSRLDAELTADDLIELRRAGVDEPVIQYLAGAASFAGGGSSYRGEPNDRPVAYSGDSGDGETVAVDPGYRGSYGGWGWGWGWGWPYYGWGWGYGWPYYGSVFISGGGHFHGGHGGHGGGGHGGGHGGHR